MVAGRLAVEVAHPVVAAVEEVHLEAVVVEVARLAGAEEVAAVVEPLLVVEEVAAEVVVVHLLVLEELHLVVHS